MFAFYFDPEDNGIILGLAKNLVSKGNFNDVHN